MFIKILLAVSSAWQCSCCVPVGHGRRVVVVEAGLSRPHTPLVCAGLVGDGVVHGAGRQGAQGPTGGFRHLHRVFRIFVSSRIFQKNTVNSYSKARRGRCCFDCPRLQSAPGTSCPLLKLSLVGRRHYPGDVGKGGGEEGWRGGGMVVAFIMLRYLVYETSVSRVKILE